MLDGQSWNRYDVVAGALWIISTTLIVYDAFTYHGDGLGPLTPFGGMIALAAVTLTCLGIGRRVQEEILSQMHRVFTMGRESVRGIDSRR